MATSNTIFSNYHPNGHQINPSLLWEYDMSTFDWQRSKVLVAQRIILLNALLGLTFLYYDPSILQYYVRQEN
jgi:hypothetical protein